MTDMQTGTLDQRHTTRLRDWSGKSLGYVAGLFSIGVVVQVFLAGAGTFGMNSTHVDQASSFEPHRAMGNALGIVAVLLLLLALLARPSTSVVLGAFALALLTELAQHGLAQAGVHHRWLGALHAGDGALILLLGCWVTKRTWPATGPR
jgi:Mn2+/Fe2+ NRAMP family transporter